MDSRLFKITWFHTPFLYRQGTRSGRARWGVVPVIARYLVRSPVSARVMRLSNFSDFLIALAKLVLRLGCVATSCNLRLLGGWPKTPRWAKTLPFDGKVSHGPNSWNYVRNTIKMASMTSLVWEDKRGQTDFSCLRSSDSARSVDLAPVMGELRV